MDRNSRTGAIPRRSRPLGANPRPRTGALLRALLAAGVLSLSAGAARASVLVSIDKSTQRMSVSVDGVPRYHWAVSTGRAGYGTPSGTYRPQRMERTWFSKEYYNSPMPHSIFFHGGYAIHRRLRRSPVIRSVPTRKKLSPGNLRAPAAIIRYAAAGARVRLQSMPAGEAADVI